MRLPADPVLVPALRLTASGIAAAGPSRYDTATARFSATIGDGDTSRRRSYRWQIETQSVFSNVATEQWRAAIAASR